ncbi:MAG: hypothetical protein J6Z14_01585 [Prevotella sp.]|nr:hypothetical protein [Prevotella sp.]
MLAAILVICTTAHDGGGCRSVVGRGGDDARGEGGGIGFNTGLDKQKPFR